MRKLILCTATVLMFTATCVFALDKDDEDALRETQKLLTDQQAMQAFTKDNKDAAGALSQVNQLTGGNKQQQMEVNDISSSVFADIVKQSNGDNVAIQARLQQALKDPNGFLKTLSPDQQARIHSLAGQIDKQNGGAAVQQAPAASQLSASQLQQLQGLTDTAPKANRAPASP